MTTSMYDYTVIEDNGGGLHLYLFAPGSDKPLATFDGFEYTPGNLIDTLDSLDSGDAIDHWEGRVNLDETLARWEYLQDNQFGYDVIAYRKASDTERTIKPEKMGRAGQIEFGIEEEITMGAAHPTRGRDSMSEPNINIKVRVATRNRLRILAARMELSMMDCIDRLVNEATKQLDQQEKQKMNTVTLKFVAQSGHVWEETVNADEVDTTVEQTVAVHGDIERVEKLADPNDMSGEVIWRFE